jgi:hypothetical protein
MGTDDREREALARQVREELDAYYGAPHRRFRRWWRSSRERPADHRQAVRRGSPGFVEPTSTVDTELLKRAVETLVRCAELDEVEEEIGADVVDGAVRLNQYLPAGLRVDLPGS